ncbi:unnamed protein product [Meloidogyne enterolobii]|uniref:Uncharacterized protein n=1 Tax=Meloidogyne enterolobii TaxID=390850 RepID=A0ACB0ZRP2_MELEN
MKEGEKGENKKYLNFFFSSFLDDVHKIYLFLGSLLNKFENWKKSSKNLIQK